MSERVPVFDRWGNYVGYFTEAPGCGPYGAIAVLLFIAPLLAIFHMVNVFRIGKRLLEKGERKKAILWFTPWPGAPVVYGLGALLFGKMESTGSSIMDGVLGCSAMLLMLVMAAGYLVQWYFIIKYSDLDF